MRSKVSHVFSKSDGKSLSSFGKYQLKDEIVLDLPNNTITIRDLGNGRLLYTRNSGNETIKKLIQAKAKTQQIELAPALPIHMPSYKTDFFFIRFEEPLYIEEDSSIETTLAFPIEIGLFLVYQNKTSGFDFFSCDPSNSRFGLYGTPEDGKLCKYATISLDDKRVLPQPFIHTQFKLNIANELEESIHVGKIVFPVTDHDLYYRENQVMMDGLQATIKNRVGLHVIETVQNPIIKQTGWSLASRDTEKTDYKFSMERGFD